MSTPQGDYIAFWQAMALGVAIGALAIVTTLIATAWLFFGLVVIGGMRRKTRTAKRVLLALVLGPLLLRDSGFMN